MHPLRFHSISFPNEWGVQCVASSRPSLLRFHSISFPNEWGGQGTTGVSLTDDASSEVSIQLVSPTSGEAATTWCAVPIPPSFHSISFPNEWGELQTN